jgi:hypothetical protein
VEYTESNTEESVENVENVENIEENVEETEVQTPQERPEPGEIEYTKNVEKRIGKLKRKNYETLRELEKIRKENERLKGSDERPTPPSMNSYVDEAGTFDEVSYNQAVVAHEDRLYQWRESKRIREDQEFMSKSNHDAIVDDWNIKAEIIKSKYEDFDEVMNKPIFSDPVIKELYLSDPEVGYYLAKNEKEAMRFNQMSSSQLSRELGKLEEKISNISKKTSNAPEPITPVGNKGSLPEDKNLSDDEWYQKERRLELEKLKKTVG